MDSEPQNPPSIGTINQPAAQPISESAQSTPAPQAPPVVLDQVDIQDFAKIKLCVAQILSVEKVEKSKKLYKLQIDVGVLGKRQIVSGIAQFYTPEQLVGRRIIIVSNLKPAMLMGIESQGMLLAASTPDKAALSLLTPAEEIPVGSFIS